MSTGVHWYVVHTHPQHEARADLNLRRQGFTTYLPRYLRNRRHARPDGSRRPAAVSALSVCRPRSGPRSLAEHPFNLRGDPPGRCGRSAPASSRWYCRCHPGQRRSPRICCPGIAGWDRSGQPVRLIDGIFADAKGILERIADARRVAVLLELLGREVRVFVPAQSVAAT